MKKPIALFLIATLFGLVGCGDDKKSEEMEFREAEKLLFVDNNCTKAIPAIEKMAHQNKNSGLTLQGLMYERGLCQEIDIEKAIQSYEKATNDNYAPAMNALAGLYLSQNYKNLSGDYAVDKAIELLKKSIHKNQNSHAMLLMGKIYYDDTYQHKDIEKAKFWLNKAHENGDSNAKVLLDRISS